MSPPQAVLGVALATPGPDHQGWIDLAQLHQARVFQVRLRDSEQDALAAQHLRLELAVLAPLAEVAGQTVDQLAERRERPLPRRRGRRSGERRARGVGICAA